MHPLFEHQPRFGGVRTRALELEGEGPSLLLLHGFADSADTWRYTLDLMRRQGRRALAVDMPGFGAAASLRPGEVLPQLDRFAAAAVEYLDDPDVIVVGNSLGGCVAMRAAQESRPAVGGVVAVAPAGLDMATWLAVIEGERLVRALLAAPLPVPELVVRQVVGRLYATLAFANPRKIDPGVVAAFTSHVRTRDIATRLLATGRRLRPELDDPFDLASINCPLLLVWGDRDRMVFSTGAERVLTEVPGSRLEVIENCGHCPQIEVPRRFGELLLAFPASLARAA